MTVLEQAYYVAGVITAVASVLGGFGVVCHRDEATQSNQPSAIGDCLGPA